MSETTTVKYGLGADWSSMYIDGEWITAEGRETISVSNPSTGETLFEVPAGTKTDVDDAFRVAEAAQKKWAAKPPQVRAEVIQNFLSLLDKHADEVTELMTAESGSTHLKTGLELEQLAPGIIAEAASFPTRSKGEVSQSLIPGKENRVVRNPAGIVGVITPWNFPFHLAMRVIAPAIALGNSVVLKPDEHTPVVGGLVIAQMFEEAGLPEGVLNVVTGRGETAGERIASHPKLDVLSFTGSTEVGRHVGGLAAESLALPALELGGNAPFVVLDDADLEVAIDAAVSGSFIHQGQVCISINRHIVHTSVYDDYVNELVDRAEQLSVGDTTDPTNIIGPIINESQRDQMLDFIEKTVREGATVETGGEHENLFVEPTVISNVSNEMDLCCNEHFGPIAPVIEVSDDEEAVAVANDTKMGLSSSVFGEEGHATEIADQVEAGMVHVNDMPLNDEPHIPFGGVKASGLGRYNGEAIIDELTETKWISVQHHPRDYPM
jgi:aldehyde dehydrogenase (NAD+)